MSTFVTLAAVLETRGAPLQEVEVWSLLLGAADLLLDMSCKGSINLCSIISPGSLLLSANGTLAFKSCACSEEVRPFTAPEAVLGRGFSPRTTSEKAIIYSLGMTLYWSVDYQIPQNQPVPLSDRLNGLLLSMCEGEPQRRSDLLTVLKACDAHRCATPLPSPQGVIKQLVQCVFVDLADSASLYDSTPCLRTRSQTIRERLRSKGCDSPGRTACLMSLSGCGYEIRASGESSERSMEPETGPGGSCRQTTWPVKSSTSPVYWPESDRTFRGLHHGGGNCSYRRSSTYLDSHHHRESSLSRLSGTLVSPRAKDLGPEVFRALGEPPVPLELPGSILVNVPVQAGKVSCTQRDLCVVMPSGQRLLVKCDVKSKAGDIFDLVVAHGNLVEHFYFGLAFIEDDEFFFLDHEMKIVKVVPECWKKEAPADIVLFLRVKFFVDDFSFLLHKLTRHQYYLQLRKDVLEDRLHADEGTSLVLGALALQAEFGNYALEVCGKNWYRLDQYVSKCVLEKRALPCLKEDLDNLYASQARMSPEEAELQFIKVAQQLPEYGVQFHRVAREKKCAAGEPILGICANGITVFDVRNDSRIAKLEFRWEETAAISAKQRKFSFKIGAMGQRYTFLTKSSKIARYLRDVCSAQHKFHSEMNSRRLNHSLVFEENIVQYAARCKAQERFPDWLSCSVVALNNSRLHSTSSTSSSRSCGDLPTRAVARVGRGGVLGERCGEKGRQDWSSQDLSSCQQSTLSLERRDLETSGVRGPQMTIARAEREIISVSLKKDPKLGLGIVIVGDDNAEGLDLGIFIASVVPSGPADKDGRIRPGARLISLNKTSLEGVAFSAVAEVLQGSSEEVELIVSQPKRSDDLRLGASYNSDYKPSPEDLDKVLSAMMIRRSRSTLHQPAALLQEGGCSRRVSVTSLKAEEMHYVKLKKSDGSLGFSVTAGKQGGVFVGSIVPGGVASQDGRLQIGDRLVEVDGIRLQGSTPPQALQYLRRTGEVVSLAFTREAPGGSQSASSEPWRSPVVPSNTRIAQVGNGGSIAISAASAFPVMTKDHDVVSDDHTLEVTLKKNRGGLGFSFLISGQDSQGDCATTVRIKRLFPGQPAERCRLIQEGDVILAVNGERLKGLSYQRVLQLLQDAPALVRLSLCRPSPEDGAARLGEKPSTALTEDAVTERRGWAWKHLNVFGCPSCHEYLGESQKRQQHRDVLPCEPRDLG